VAWRNCDSRTEGSEVIGSSAEHRQFPIGCRNDQADVVRSAEADKAADELWVCDDRYLLRDVRVVESGRECINIYGDNTSTTCLAQHLQELHPATSVDQQCIQGHSAKDHR
jgi:hypothetical protein